MTDTAELVDNYVALWNEPDEEARRRRVRELWATAGRQVITPPSDIVDLARPLGFPSPTLTVAGHDDLDFRVSRAYEEFIKPGVHAFRARSNGARLENIVLMSWDMVSLADGEVVGGGTDMFVLDDDDRILVDYQFVDP